MKYASKSFVCFAGLLGLILYQNMQQPQLRLNPLLDRLTHPFDQRIRYRIAEVDPRFGLNEHELKQISQQATDIWKQGLGQDYFVYDPNARLSIRLIYDQRQDESIQRRDQLSKLTQNEHGLSQKILNSKPCNKIWQVTRGPRCAKTESTRP